MLSKVNGREHKIEGSNAKFAQVVAGGEAVVAQGIGSACDPQHVLRHIDANHVEPEVLQEA